jgi:predicted nucleotidyltransferase
VRRWVADRLPRLLRRPDVVEAWLFGSFARGDADGYSDLDVMVVANTRRPFVDRFRDFPELLRDVPVGLDLLVYTPAEFADARRTNRFVRHALRTAKRVV